MAMTPELQAAIRKAVGSIVAMNRASGHALQVEALPAAQSACLSLIRDHAAELLALAEPRIAHSKSEYKRLVAQGVDVLPPKEDE